MGKIYPGRAWKQADVAAGMSGNVWSRLPIGDILWSLAVAMKREIITA
jgi:hypothetical protein